MGGAKRREDGERWKDERSGTERIEIEMKCNGTNETTRACTHIVASLRFSNPKLATVSTGPGAYYVHNEIFRLNYGL